MLHRQPYWLNTLAQVPSQQNQGVASCTQRFKGTPPGNQQPLPARVAGHFAQMPYGKAARTRPSPLSIDAVHIYGHGSVGRSRLCACCCCFIRQTYSCYSAWVCTGLYRHCTRCSRQCRRNPIDVPVRSNSCVASGRVDVMPTSNNINCHISMLHSSSGCRRRRIRIGRCAEAHGNTHT